MEDYFDQKFDEEEGEQFFMQKMVGKLSAQVYKKHQRMIKIDEYHKKA